MTVSREAILDKTNYGIGIYAYVLRRYYPGATVLSLHGRACSPAQNPFREDKSSLMVTINNGVAQHSDTEDPDFCGDAFDFASLYFNKEGQALLNCIDEAMHLGITKPKGLYQQATSNNDQQITTEAPVQVPRFNIFLKPISNTIPNGTVSIVELYWLIRDDMYARVTQQLRAINDVKKARSFKAKSFDYATLSGTFSKRSDKALLAHSGLMTIDFDHIDNIPALRAALLKDEYFETELLFISPSGDGLKWVIAIDLTVDTHTNYFNALAIYIKQTYQVDIDKSGKDISRACFIPHDKDVYINPKYLEK